MARKAKQIKCSEEDRKRLEKISNSQTEPHNLVRRSKIILACLSGKQIKDISKEIGETETTIIKWRTSFEVKGINGLNDEPRSGKPITYGKEFRDIVLAKLTEKPPNGLSRWDGAELAKELNTSDDAIWRLLRKEGICLARQRTWCVSTDPEFTQKAADIVGLYLNAPENAIVISVDEKPSIQALTRPTGYVCTGNKKIISGIKSTYKRNGTINLFAALQIATGSVYAKDTKTKTRVDFISFMDDLLRDLSVSETAEIHVILDNYCIHKKCDEWLSKHENVHFHYTPTSASWLNQIEIWFGIMTRKVLRGASHNSTELLVQAIKSYTDYYNQNPTPFVWRKREVSGSQLRNNIINLCN